MNESAAFIQTCSFCESGLIRFVRCGRCGAVVGLCDECELIWADIPALSLDNTIPSDSSHPTCPVCRSTNDPWTFLDDNALRETGLDVYQNASEEP